jgi:hypothetical protein
MDYNNGSVYGYDQIQSTPIMNTFDNPYLQVPRIARDRQYVASAGNYHSSGMIPSNHHEGCTSESIRKPNQLNVETAVKKEGMHNMPIPDGDKNGMLLIFIFILILMVVVNSVTLKHLTSQLKCLRRKTRDLQFRIISTIPTASTIVPAVAGI